MLGNMYGQLFMLFLETADNGKGCSSVREIKVELLGEYKLKLHHNSYKFYNYEICLNLHKCFHTNFSNALT